MGEDDVLLTDLKRETAISTAAASVDGDNFTRRQLPCLIHAKSYLDHAGGLDVLALVSAKHAGNCSVDYRPGAAEIPPIDLDHSATEDGAGFQECLLR